MPYLYLYLYVCICICMLYLYLYLSLYLCMNLNLKLDLLLSAIGEGMLCLPVGGSGTVGVPEGQRFPRNASVYK